VWARYLSLALSCGVITKEVLCKALVGGVAAAASLCANPSSVNNHTVPF
jgi:hypothetical protein